MKARQKLQMRNGQKEKKRERERERKTVSELERGREENEGGSAKMAMEVGHGNLRSFGIQVWIIIG